MQTVSKHRTPSQCREWERQRRLKFNQAIAQLGDIVKNINKESNVDCDMGKDSDNAKFPKIEIVQKAIICLTKFMEEKTQLKTEILALQIKLERVQSSISKKDASIQAYVKGEYKEASTQVHIEIQKRNKNGKIMKLVMVKKSKENTPVKSKELSKPTVVNEKKIVQRIQPKPTTSLQNLPKILPFSQENTIVVLPAAPYIFPQRPLMFPSAPPAIVFVDPNIQALSKSVPIVSRNNGDSTKTTMVNILPISAYSRPLSAIKQKKSNVRLKTVSKKVTKKSKPLQPKEIQKGDIPSTNEAENKKDKTIIQDVAETTTTTVSESVKLTDSGKTLSNTTEINKQDVLNEKNMSSNTSDNIKDINTDVNINSKVSEEKIVNELPKTTASESAIKTTVTPTTTQSITCVKTNENNEKLNKNVIDKIVAQEEKEREKLPSLLDTGLCDSAVDGGNARLELAEEFLAASPTAAFLMSFPLVSGNRADSPAEETQTNITTPKDSSQRRPDLLPTPQQSAPQQPAPYFEKTNNAEPKNKIDKQTLPASTNKQNEQNKFTENTIPKSSQPKVSASTTLTNSTQDNPFLNLQMPSIISTSCTLSDPAFGLDFDCNLNKPATNQSTYVSNSNIFYKNDPFSTVKSTIYSTSTITNNHEFNGLGLYPCAMEKYTSKNKPEYTNMDENNVMKIGSSRLTYDIDLGWSHKGFDFVNCTTTGTTFSKDNIVTTLSSTTPFCTSYNPFNPEFHVPLVSSNSNKKDIAVTKANTSFAETITSFYSQSASLWTDEPFYTNSNVPKTLSKHQTYLPLDNTHTTNNKNASNKQYGVKENSDVNIETNLKTNSTLNPHMNEKYTKKSPSKMHINWMTSEIRPMHTNYNTPHVETKETHKPTYNHLEQTKRQDLNETNSYFPISMHNFTTQTGQEEFQVWPSARPLGTTEISIEPPPINLPTLVGDLALGPHEKKKSIDVTNRALPQQDLQNCNNFFSVTQLMNRSSDNISSRYPAQPETTKSISTKQNSSIYTHDNNRKAMTSRVESNLPQPYVFNDPKLSHPYENMAQYSQTQTKAKSNSKSDKNQKSHKNNYSAEALLRGASCSQKIQDNKFLMPSQRYNDFNSAQDSSVAQVSHFPPIIDYADNSYTGQQFSGTSLYNTTTNTLSNSFYSNFMPGSSNLMSANYPSGPFTGEFIDYNQSAECNYNNHKYEELKMRNNPPVFQTDKVPTNYKSSRRESAAKHKLECSKKETSKKYQSKRAKLNNEIEEWNDPSHTLWQNKTSTKRHSNLMSEEIPFPNYVGNQMSTQYQADFFNSHLMPSNMQAVPHNVDRSLASFPITSRANFNLSTIFPEITMKVQ